MATEVKKYHILFYGSPSGYQTNRAQIALYDSSNLTVLSSLRGIQPPLRHQVRICVNSDEFFKGMVYIAAYKKFWKA